MDGFVEATPSALFERVSEALQGASVPALWADSSSTNDLMSLMSLMSEPELFASAATIELAFGVGAPHQACQLEQDEINVKAPITLNTSDGKVALQQDAVFALSPDDDETSVAIVVVKVVVNSPWIPVNDFETITGIKEVTFAGGQFGQVDIETTFDLTSGATSGRLFINMYKNGDPQSADYPTLLWSGTLTSIQVSTEAE